MAITYLKPFILKVPISSQSFSFSTDVYFVNYNFNKQRYGINHLSNISVSNLGIWCKIAQIYYQRETSDYKRSDRNSVETMVISTEICAGHYTVPKEVQLQEQEVSSSISMSLPKPTPVIPEVKIIYVVQDDENVLASVSSSSRSTSSSPRPTVVLSEVENNVVNRNQNIFTPVASSRRLKIDSVNSRELSSRESDFARISDKDSYQAPTDGQNYQCQDYQYQNYYYQYNHYYESPPNNQWNSSYEYQGIYNNPEYWYHQQRYQYFGVYFYPDIIIGYENYTNIAESTIEDPAKESRRHRSRKDASKYSKSRKYNTRSYATRKRSPSKDRHFGLRYRDKPNQRRRNYPY